MGGGKRAQGGYKAAAWLRQGQGPGLKGQPWPNGTVIGSREWARGGREAAGRAQRRRCRLGR
jgi:hypothetical protein